MTPTIARNADPAKETDPLLLYSPVGEYDGETDSLSEEETTLPQQQQQQQTPLESLVQTATEMTENVIENIQDFTEAAVETTQEITTNIADNVVDEVHDVQEAIMTELHDADEGELAVLDMMLARNLAILPSEFQHAVDMLQEQQQEEEEADIAQEGDPELQQQHHQHLESSAAAVIELEPVMATIKESSHGMIPFSAYLVLASAVISLSSIGPLLQFQTGTTPTMKMTWRMAGTAMLLTPIAVLDMKRHGGFPHLTSPQWFTFLLSTVSYVIFCLAFATALDYTSVGNAVILGNSQAIMLLLGNICVGAPVTFLEGTGAVVAFVGAILCSKDSSDGAGSRNGGSSGVLTLYGDGLALLSGLGGCGYLIFAKTSRAHMGLFVFMWLTMLGGCLLALLLQLFVLKEDVTLDTDRTTGFFGFLNFDIDRLPLEVFIVIVCNLCGTMGYVRAMQFFDSLVISVAGLMEPVVAEFIGFGIGTSALPGLSGWIGNFLVTFGTLAVVFPTSAKQGKGMDIH